MHSLLPLILLLCSIVAHADNHINPVTINESQHYIGTHTSVYRDSEQAYQIDTIHTLDWHAFTPLKKGVHSEIFTNDVFYYRFQVFNHQKITLSRAILFETPWLDNIQVKVVPPNQQNIKVYQTGNTFPFSQRALTHQYPNVLHHFEPGISTVYVRVETRDPFIVPISITSTTDLYKDYLSGFTITGLVYGLILAILIYHLILYINFRQPYYGYYVAYMSAFLFMNASYSGYTFQFLIPNMPVLQNWLQSSAIFLFSICGLLFAQSFLNLKHYLRWAKYAIDYFLITVILAFIITAFMGYHWHVIASIATAFVFSLFLLVISFIALLKKHRPARFFFAATATGFIGTSITSLTVMAIIPYSYLGYRAVEFGMVVDCILLSLALVDRVKVNEERRQYALQLAKTDELTQLPNRRAYNEICDNEQQYGQYIYHETLTTMMIDIDHFKKVNDIYGHTAGDTVLRVVANQLRHSICAQHRIFRMGGEEFLILLIDATTQESKALAESIRKDIEKLTIVLDKTHQIKVTISIGISEQKTKHQCILEKQEDADKALYKAKQTGRNKIIHASKTF